MSDTIISPEGTGRLTEATNEGFVTPGEAFELMTLRVDDLDTALHHLRQVRTAGTGDSLFSFADIVLALESGVSRQDLSELFAAALSQEDVATGMHHLTQMARQRLSLRHDRDNGDQRHALRASISIDPLPAGVPREVFGLRRKPESEEGSYRAA